MLTPKETGQGNDVYPVPIDHSALCESGFSSTGSVAANAAMALGWKPTVVDTGHALCDPTHHYLLTVRKAGTTVTVWKQDVELGEYTTSAATYAELLAEALATFAGADNGYVSRLAVVESALDYASFHQVSASVAGLWVPGGLDGLDLHTLLDFADAADLGADASGNGNDWVLSGASQSSDTPTNNGCTLHPLDNATTGTLSEGNLTTSGSAKVTLRPSSGKWYYEKDGSGVSYDADTEGQFDPTLAAGTYNFGGTDWADTGPAGDESPLMDAGLPEPDVLDAGRHHGAYLFTAPVGASQTIDVGFDVEADDFLLVLKNRDSVGTWYWIDSVRGLDRTLYGDVNTAEAVLATAISASGTSVSLPDDLLSDGENYVLYVIRSCAEAGLDIVTYTGTGSVRTVPHSLGVTPNLINVLCRTAANSHAVYAEPLGASKAVRTDLYNSAGSSALWWNGTAPTSSEFTVSTSAEVNGLDEEYVAYVFADTEIARVFSYSGNANANGPYADLGGPVDFIPFYKCTTSSYGWQNYDVARDRDNPASQRLMLSETDAEETVASPEVVFTSSGLKVATSSYSINKAGLNFGRACLRATKYRNAF